MHWKIKQIEQKQQALFVGFFGPIGVSAVFYLYVSLEFLQDITVNGVVREDAARLREVMTVVIWFLAICSIVSFVFLRAKNAFAHRSKVVHGLSVPVGKLGYHLPRTISDAVLSRDTEEPEGFHIREHVQNQEGELRQRNRQRQENRNSNNVPLRPVFRIGRSVIHSEGSNKSTPTVGGGENPLNDVPSEDLAHDDDIRRGNDLKSVHDNVEPKPTEGVGLKSDGNSDST